MITLKIGCMNGSVDLNRATTNINVVFLLLGGKKGGAMKISCNILR